MVSATTRLIQGKEALKMIKWKNKTKQNNQVPL